LSSGQEDSKDGIHEVIGHAVSRLIATGKPLDRENILAQLRLGEAHAVDGRKKIYAEAVRYVTESKAGRG